MLRILWFIACLVLWIENVFSRFFFWLVLLYYNLFVSDLFIHFLGRYCFVADGLFSCLGFASPHHLLLPLAGWFIWLLFVSLTFLFFLTGKTQVTSLIALYVVYVSLMQKQRFTFYILVNCFWDICVSGLFILMTL